ncbi:hypothetical protein V6N13_131387 [Hibiscus sabdariffa]
MFGGVCWYIWKACNAVVFRDNAVLPQRSILEQARAWVATVALAGPTMEQPRTSSGNHQRMRLPWDPPPYGWDNIYWDIIFWNCLIEVGWFRFNMYHEGRIVWLMGLQNMSRAKV